VETQPGERLVLDPEWIAPGRELGIPACGGHEGGRESGVGSRGAGIRARSWPGERMTREYSSVIRAQAL
jgi:hypothetical protein